MPTFENDDNRAKRFSELSLEHMKGLYSVALQLTRHPAQAEDLVQETYLKSFERFEQFRSGTNFKAWIFKILRNTFISQYHRNKAHPHVALDSVEHALGSHDIDDALDARVETKSVRFRTALAGLPANARVMLFLAYVEEFTYKEIAEIMECPVGTVMSRLFRARQHLKQQLAESRRDAPSQTTTTTEAA